MPTIREEVLQANRSYSANFHERAGSTAPRVPRFLILTCMDARLDPMKFAGLEKGDTHVFRNAGGRATEDAIRSLVISHKFFGTREWFVIHHTDCGLETFTDPQMGELLEESLGPASIVDGCWCNQRHDSGSDAGRRMKWMTIADREKSVVDDVRTIREHPLVSPEVTIYGFIYDVETGQLTEIDEASAIGRPAAA